jgi:hypothetical protein
MNHDIIGDIHGHADALEKLLQKMGYKRFKGIYRHSERQAIFLGDFIDRGPKIRETLHLVKDMVDAGYAQAIMGNHEYNAVCFNTENRAEGGFYREHNFEKIKQHYKTLEQFHAYPEEWKQFLNWFRKLPMYLDLKNCKVVHAYWNDDNIQWLEQHYQPKGEGLSDAFLNSCYREGLPGFKAVEETLKGPEHRLPDGKFMVDKEGINRRECRLKWWAINKSTMGEGIMECPPELRNNPMPEGFDSMVFTSDKPVFFGHYWLKGAPKIENDSAICLDYSIAKDGILVAARLNQGEKPILIH